MDSKMSTSTTLGLNEQSEFSDRTRSLKQYSNSVMFTGRNSKFPISMLWWIGAVDITAVVPTYFNYQTYHISYIFLIP